MTEHFPAPPTVETRLAWCGACGDDPAGMRLDEFLRQFVGAAIAADRRYVRTGDAADVEAGIGVWETLATAGQLGATTPESAVDAYLSVSMLYARRYEARGGGGDLSLALHYLDQARRHVEEGSFADLQVRMSMAAWLMLRFQAEGRHEDLDEAIAGWSRLLGSDADALAAANLGRALLDRHELTGQIADLHEGRRLLGMASVDLPSDHPALRDVQFALRAAG
jgi:hypothetical protein